LHFYKRAEYSKWDISVYFYVYSFYYNLKILIDFIALSVNEYKCI